MKRTFLVEIEEQSDSTVGITDIGHALTILRTDRCVVTETTAVHHAERMVINRALIWDAPGFSENRTPKLQQAVRELRALMEGKA